VNSERLRTVRRIAIYAVVGIAVYVAALMFCFPYDRVKEMAIAMAAQAGVELEIATAGPAFPLGVSFEDIRVRPRPAVPLSKPIQIHLDSARVPFLPIVLSGGNGFEVVVRALGGRIAIAASSRKGGPMHNDIRVDDLNLAQVPGVRELWNLPLTGTLNVGVRLDSKTGRFADANGEIEFKCATCTLGDGKAAVKFGGANPFLAAGLTLPRVRLGDFGGRVAIEKGVARAQGVAVKSADAELTLDGEVVLRDPLAYSAVNAYVRFKLGDALLKNASAIASVLQMAGAPGLRPDGFYGLRLSGLFSAMSAVLTPTSPLGGGSGGPGRLGARSPVVPTASPPSGQPEVVPIPDDPAPAAPSPPPPPPPAPAPVVALPPTAPAATATAPPPPPPEAAVAPPPTDFQPAPAVRGSGVAGMMEGAARRSMAALTVAGNGSSTTTGAAGLGGALGGVGPASPGDASPRPSPAGPPAPPSPPSPPGAPAPASPTLRGPPPTPPPPPPPPPPPQE
jgi:type II secretion system protein N